MPKILGCADCKFWTGRIPGQPDHFETVCSCVRHASAIQPASEQNKDWAPIGYWPLTVPSHGCGEFQPCGDEVYGSEWGWESRPWIGRPLQPGAKGRAGPLGSPGGQSGTLEE